MNEWAPKHRWVCPRWEFSAFVHNWPDKPFSETWVETRGTWISILNPWTHNVNVKATFYNDLGQRDSRFGFDMVSPGQNSFTYRTDFSQHYPKPPPGTHSKGWGWFEVAASHNVYLAGWIHNEQKTAFARAVALSLPFYELPTMTLISGLFSFFTRRARPKRSESEMSSEDLARVELSDAFPLDSPPDRDRQQTR